MYHYGYLLIGVVLQCLIQIIVDNG